MNRTPLSSTEISRRLVEFPGWTLADDKLCRTYCFDSYKATIWFVMLIAGQAEIMDHHPVMVVGYGQVAVSTCTHDAGDKVTQMDIALAARIEMCYGRVS